MNIKGILRIIFEWMSVGLGLILLSVYDLQQNQYWMFGTALGCFLICVVVTIGLTDSRYIYSRLYAAVAVVTAFVACRRRKLSKTQLVLERRLHAVGSYSELYLDTIKRYYDLQEERC